MNIKKIASLTLFCFLLLSNAIFAYRFLQLKQKVNQPVVIDSQVKKAPQSDQDAPAEDKPWTLKESPSLNRVRIIGHRESNRYPYQIDLAYNFEQRKPWNVSIKTLDDLRASYQEEFESDFCPGPCQALSEEGKLEAQFETLRKASRQPNCLLTEEMESEIKSFILFAGSPGSNEEIGMIYNPELEICGIKFIGNYGYDLYLGNYAYYAAFLKDDKLIKIWFELLPTGKFKEIDEIWASLGYNFEDGSLGGSDNYNKMTEYMENMDFETEPLKSLIELYDKSAKSFKFID